MSKVVVGTFLIDTSQFLRKLKTLELLLDALRLHVEPEWAAREVEVFIAVALGRVPPSREVLLYALSRVER